MHDAQDPNNYIHPLQKRFEVTYEAFTIHPSQKSGEEVPTPFQPLF